MNKSKTYTTTCPHCKKSFTFTYDDVYFCSKFSLVTCQNSKCKQRFCVEQDKKKYYEEVN